MDDESYEGLFRPIMDSIMANYQPDAIVLQSGETCGPGAAAAACFVFCVLQSGEACGPGAAAAAALHPS
jgi:hypothetical protein